MEILVKIPWWGWLVIISWLPAGYVSIMKNSYLRPDPPEIGNYKVGRAVYAVLGWVTFFISIPHWLGGKDWRQRKNN